MKKQHAQPRNDINPESVKKTILLVGEEGISSSFLIKMLERKRFQVKFIPYETKRRSRIRFSADLILMNFNHDCFIVEQYLDLIELKNVPILFMSDFSRSHCINDCFMMSCNNFIVKPFSSEELTLRIRLAISDHNKNKINYRQDAEPEKDVFKITPRIKKESFFAIDDDAKKILIQKKSIQLTPKQYKLFCLLASEFGLICSNKKIIDHLWPTSNSATKCDIQQCIYGLRKKIETDPSQPRYLHQVPGIGYKLEDVVDGDIVHP